MLRICMMTVCAVSAGWCAPGLSLAEPAASAQGHEASAPARNIELEVALVRAMLKEAKHAQPPEKEQELLKRTRDVLRALERHNIPPEQRAKQEEALARLEESMRRGAQRARREAIKRARDRLALTLADPDVKSVEAWSLLGEISVQLEDKRFARYAYEAIDRLQPSYGDDPALKTLMESLAALGAAEEMDSVRRARSGFLSMFEKATVGHVQSMAPLGLLYSWGVGVPPSRAKAIEWFKRAFEAGDAKGAYYLGDLLDQWRLESRPDYAQAVKWYRAAADKGHTGAMRKLASLHEKGNGVEQNPALAVQWLERAASAGDVYAMRSLAAKLIRGEGVDKDATAAVKWWRSAAEKGSASAMYSLGWAYSQGEGAPKDMHEALKWWRSAAEKGNASAMYALGWTYEKGEGAPQDLPEALKWLRKSAEAGNVQAMKSLAAKLVRGEGVDKDVEAAVKWWRAAAEKGSADAMYALGLSYMEGEGVSQDMQEALKWWRKGAEAGSKLAQQALSRHEEQQAPSTDDAGGGMK